MTLAETAYTEVPNDPSCLIDQQQHLPKTRKTSWKHRYAQGWRFGILTGSLLATTVLIINTIATILVATNHWGSREGDSYQGTLYEGDCDETRKLNVGLHLAINILSTLLLGASNYAMQCLSAPTRSEIDAAHSRFVWLDVGIPSIRNLFRVSKKRSILWLILGFSSLPLHLLYNSTIYSTISATDYVIFMVNSSTSVADSLSMYKNLKSWHGLDQNQFASIVSGLEQKARDNKLTRLENQECIDTYATPLLTGQRHLILVSNSTSSSSTPYYYGTFESSMNRPAVGCAPIPYEWICQGASGTSCTLNGGTCTSNIRRITPDDWKPFKAPVQYCLSETAPQKCRIRFNMQIAAVVIACNLVKAAVLAFIFFTIKDNPLMTMGDAVASFTADPEERTKQLCLMSKADIEFWKPFDGHTAADLAVPYNGERKRWSQVVSDNRWSVCILLYITILTVCISLLCFGLFNARTSASELLSLGFGATDPRAFIYGWNLPVTGPSGVISNVIVANLPQMILSSIYFTYNGLFTCFMLGSEWSKYSLHRKPLRVSSHPQGAQRSTYFLQLPYRFAIPLLVLSGILHWLCSQSIFFVNVEVREQGTFYGNDSSISEYSTCGYSPRAMLGVIILGVVMVVIAIGAGGRRFSSGMPIVGSCSAAISAMCHAPDGEARHDAIYMPLKWGVTGTVDDKNPSAVGHCAFSSLEVSQPEEGKLYAGL